MKRNRNQQTYSCGGFDSSTDLASFKFTGTLRRAITATRKYVEEALPPGFHRVARIRDESGEIVYSAEV